MTVDHIKTIDTMMLHKPLLDASFVVGKKDEFAIIETGAYANGEETYQKMLKIPNFSPEKVKYIITTHIHMDHSGAASYLLKKFPNASIVHHHKTTRHLEDPSRLWESSFQTNSYTANLYGKPDGIPSDRIIPGHSGEIYSVDGFDLELIDAPGHHSYHYAILERLSNTLFVGDSCGWYWKETETIFPTTAPPRFDFNIYKETINNHMKMEPTHLAFTHYDVLGGDIQKILWQSLDTVSDWVEITKEYRSKQKNITVNETVDQLIKERYSHFDHFDHGLKDVIFGISILGIFNYLDSLENASL